MNGLLPLDQIGPRRARGLVFAAGGSADIILAKALAAGLVREGCSQVDLAQPLNCKNLSEKNLLGNAGKRYALEPEGDFDPEAVLRHNASIPSDRRADHQRGQGLSISSSLEWDHGSRYVCAAHGIGPSSLAGRGDGEVPYYDFAVGVDGGGDVLTHGDEEFDCVVLAGFRSAWSPARPLILISLGLGADGGSAPADFENMQLHGWRLVGTTVVPGAFADILHRELDRLGLWNESPASWSSDDPFWGYGFKVPQIIALAVRGDFPFDAQGEQSNLVRFPRRGELKTMDRRLLREARVFLSYGAR
jgi:hypothetical protein